VTGSTQIDTSGSGGPSITVDYRGGVAVLELVGEHDAATVESLATAIVDECADKRGVVVSFRDTDSIDSAIVRELFAGDSRMLAVGRRLVLHIDPSMPCDRLLEMVSAREHFICCEQLDEALRLAAQDDHERVPVDPFNSPPST